MAQYYHILDFEGLPVSKLAALVAGLPEHSRTKSRRNGRKEKSLVEMLLAAIVDGVKMLVWMQSEDGVKGVNRPESVFEQLLGESRKETESFDSPEEFMAARKRILEGKEENR